MITGIRWKGFQENSIGIMGELLFVEENYRGRGYAKGASTILIKELLDKNIEPDWCTWAYRTESQNLALSLGFELLNEVPAHIWVEAECDKL